MLSQSHIQSQSHSLLQHDGDDRVEQRLIDWNKFQFQRLQILNCQFRYKSASTWAINITNNKQSNTINNQHSTSINDQQIYINNNSNDNSNHQHHNNNSEFVAPSTHSSSAVEAISSLHSYESSGHDPHNLYHHDGADGGGATDGGATPVAVGGASILFERGKSYAVIGQNRSGKCWAKGMKLLLYNGNYKNVEHIDYNDILMGKQIESITQTFALFHQCYCSAL